ncbi:hypothetical protein CYMTET_35499 [Cymbomonas tetramitiformis]|uniref:Uncharacterized protein n=1 Tax=Cymbomonas tetramitiformis TaxID=36881 RepID=A0AAE0F937_9CHLO|nr:hypothetical protein CYMTET_35499 [Cymbomonas tetramitiformis]
MVLSSGSVRRASPEEYSLAEDTIGKRVKTPGWVFGKQNKGLEFYGTVTGVDKERERDGFWVLCVDVLFDDKQVCWFPIATVVQWVCDDAEGYASDTSEALADVPDLAELVEIAEAAKENGDDAIARLRFVPPKETDEDQLQDSSAAGAKYARRVVCHEAVRPVAFCCAVLLVGRLTTNKPSEIGCHFISLFA